jgi:hypothetical protein
MVFSWSLDFIDSPIIKGIHVFVIEPDDDGKQKIIANIENIIGDIIATNEWKIQYEPDVLKKFFGDDPGETKKVDGKNAVYKFISFKQAEGVLLPEDEKLEAEVAELSCGDTKGIKAEYSKLHLHRMVSG